MTKRLLAVLTMAAMACGGRYPEAPVVDADCVDGAPAQCSSSMTAAACVDGRWRDIYCHGSCDEALCDWRAAKTGDECAATGYAYGRCINARSRGVCSPSGILSVAQCEGGCSVVGIEVRCIE